MSIEAYVKEKQGYSKFYYNPKITAMHNNTPDSGLVDNPFISNSIDSNSKGVVQVRHKSSYHKLNSMELHTQALLVSQ